MITREAVRLFKNSNAFLKNIDTQYDSQFAREGAKIGTTLKIRLPNDYTVRTGAAVSVQDTAEQSTTLTVATQKGVDIAFSTVERTMSLDDYSERVLMPAMNNLAGGVAADVMSGVEGGVCNYVSSVDGSSNTIAPTLTTFLNAMAYLDENSAGRDNRKMITDNWTMARTVGTVSGLFNPQTLIGDQYKTGMIKTAIGADWFMDQTVIKHTAGTFSSGTVNGANQTGTSITTNAITGTFKKGDIITFAAVYAVNRVTKVSTGKLRQFVVTSNVATSATSIPIYPALVPASGGNSVQYQTVDASPANSATILLVNKASEVVRYNFAYSPNAVTMASADLEIPRGVHEAARSNYDGISLRVVTAYNIATDQMITRMDILYGYLWVRPEWAVLIADAV
jgi:hypothetical protein